MSFSRHPSPGATSSPKTLEALLKAHAHPVTMTTGTPAMVVYAAKNPNATLSLLHVLSKGATPSEPRLPKTVHSVLIDYAAPAILYLGQGASETRLFPAHYLERVASSSYRLVYLNNIVAVRHGHRTLYFYAPNLFTWMSHGHWKPWFRQS